MVCISAVTGVLKISVYEFTLSLLVMLCSLVDEYQCS